MPSNKLEGYGTGSFTPQKYVTDKNGGSEQGFKGHNKREESLPSLKLNRNSIKPDAYFTEFTAGKAFLYCVVTLYVIGCAVVSVAELFLTLPCPDNDKDVIEFPNPAYDGSKCPQTRQPLLLGLTPTECSFGRRLVTSMLMGGLIGWERRQADRPAGIRTMSLVSLGSCLFTINSAFAFVGGPMDWDASRISAAIPSGVGFLGAGLIFKKSEEDNMVVHGLTTAASVWLSAAVGIACGGELYFAASFGTGIMMLLLRFGPRGSDQEEEEEEEDEEEEEEQDVVQELEGGPPRGGDDRSFNIEIPPGTTASEVFRSIDGGFPNDMPTGLQLTQRSNDSKNEGGSFTGTAGEFTVTGESIETNSLAAETTPMLAQQQQQQHQAASQQQLLQLLAQQRTSASQRPTASMRSQSSAGRRTPNKSNKIRKRQSKANLGSIV